MKEIFKKQTNYLGKRIDGVDIFQQHFIMYLR